MNNGLGQHYMCKEEKFQLVLYEIIQLQENGSRNVFVSILTEEAPSYPPPKTNIGFRGFRYYHTICTAVGFFEGMVAIRSIINN